jgi:Ser/Thr protein kinase RdoA (MazF antagonist)
MEISLSYCQQILQPYGLGSIHRIERMQKGYSSLNYKVSSAKGDFLLKTFLGKSQEDVEYEMALFKLLEREFWIKLPDNQLNRAFRVDLSRLKQKIKSPKAHE